MPEPPWTPAQLALVEASPPATVQATWPPDVQVAVDAALADHADVDWFPPDDAGRGDALHVSGALGRRAESLLRAAGFVLVARAEGLARRWYVLVPAVALSVRMRVAVGAGGWAWDVPPAVRHATGLALGRGAHLERGPLLRRQGVELRRCQAAVVGEGTRAALKAAGFVVCPFPLLKRMAWRPPTAPGKDGG